jgi:integrase
MRGNITRRGKESWRLKYEIADRDPTTGKRQTRFLTVHGKRRDAEGELTRILRDLDKGIHVEPSKLTVTEYLERWLTDQAKHRVSAKTFERYDEIVRKHLSPALGSHQLGKLAPLHIQECFGKALASGRRRGNGGLSAQTVKHHHRVLSEALRQAVRWRLLQFNPCELVDPPRPVRREMKTLDHEQTAKLLKAAIGRSIYMPILIAVTTGMRRGEILGLRWRDLNLDEASLAVTQTLEQTAKTLTFKEPKTERSRRTIALPALTVEALRRHKARQAETRLKLGPAYSDHDLVCCRPDGEPTSPRAVTKAFSVLIADLGMKARFHDLRHSHISHLLAAGVHPKIASERAGHASVSITLDVYSHVIPGMQEDAASRIDAALRTHLER